MACLDSTTGREHLSSESCFATLCPSDTQRPNRTPIDENMSFGDLAGGGAACGPSNPLQNLGKRFGQDRSSQLDRFGGHLGAASGSRSSGFRSSPAPGQSHTAEGFLSPVGPLDLSSLTGALPHSHQLEGPSNSHALRGASPADFEASFRSPQQQQPLHLNKGSHAWSSDFLGGAHTASAPVLAANGSQQGSATARSGFANGHVGGLGGYNVQRSRFGPQMGGGMAGYAPHLQGQHSSPLSSSQSAQMAQQERPQVDDRVWSEAFTAYDENNAAMNTAKETLGPEALIERADMTPAEADELARTAGKLVSTVEHDQNDKFKQSNFLNLMRKLRDREAGIHGTDIVDTPEGASASAPASALDKGKGKATDFGLQHQGPPQSQQEAIMRAQARAQGSGGLQLSGSTLERMAHQEGQSREWLNDLWAEEDQRSEAIEEKARQDLAARQAFVGDGGDLQARMREDDLEAREFAKFQQLNTNVLGADSRLRTGWEEEAQDDVAHDEDYSHEDFVGRRWEGQKGRGRPAEAQAREWDKLQADWDAFEAGPHGLRPAQTPQAFEAASVPRYQFQASNPYLETTRQHMMHALETVPEDVRSILEAEAAVQVEPTDAAAWYSLGVKQQENERERAAIAALHRAIQINPLMKDAWLALAVSYTNEGDRRATFESLERWIDSNERYSDVVASHRAATGEKGEFGRADLPYIERHSRVVSALLSIARHGSQHLGEVDADVQVALGVLFNASDEFNKAVDCFSAAISVRPEDWLLYNRLGAVLSNSGRSDEALHYYRYALDLKPDFARCHFNLAISCLNLKMYADAASHSYTALALQDSHAQQQGGHHLSSSYYDDNSNDGDVSVVGRDGNGSLWETLRVSLELLNRPDLARRTYKRDISLFDPADLVVPGDNNAAAAGYSSASGSNGGSNGAIGGIAFPDDGASIMEPSH
ncbi:unnamed protein product [Parajaminaea phylloscopi]